MKTPDNMTMKQIFTPTTLYVDFQPDLPLRDTVVSDERLGDIIYNEVYFNGRQTGEGRVLIYGIYARHLDGKKHNAILIIPDYNSPLDVNVINLYVHLGYDVLMFDYRGENDESENYTNYPSDIKYANVKYAGRHLEYADVNARETCWYEWCCVARYAVSFLCSRLETNKIGVLGIKNGSEIMWHLLSCDSRVNCAVGLFGAGWRSYKKIRKYAPAEGFETDDERIRFLAGVDAHAFAPYCRCPVALFTATNSSEFDADRAHDTMRRVNKNVDSFFCLSPRMSDAVNINCTRNIELFFGIYLNGQRIQLASEPEINLTPSGEFVDIEVTTPTDPKPRIVDIYVCENQLVPARRNWTKLDEAEKVSDSVFKGRYSLVNGGEIIFAFAVVEYRNGVTVSTPISSKKCPAMPIIRTNLIYSSARSSDDFTYGIDESDLIASAIYFKRSPIEMTKGPMGIYGISSRSGLLTYMPSERRMEIKADSIFKLDVYCRDNITLSVTLTTGTGGDEKCVYTAESEVPSGEVWQTVVLSLKDFKTRDGMQVPDPDRIDSISFKANGFFAINNVLLI